MLFNTAAAIHRENENARQKIIMTPLPQNPKVVILVDGNGNVARVASNIAPLPELEVKVTDNPHDFAEEAAGKSFNQPVE